MSWEDRDQPDDPWRKLGRPGGDWHGLRPSFDNPMSWALPLLRIGGIAVRVHVLFVIFVIIMMLRARFPDKADLNPMSVTVMATALASLFVIVLAHEFGHCLACRLVGGRADEILMWPLGGLAYCQPPNRWSAHLITALGGPAVNVLICALCTTMLGLITQKWWGVAIPNLLDLNSGFNDPAIRSWAHSSLFLTNAMSLLLLLFNLIPTFPLDGGRIVQAVLWRKLGYNRSMHVAVITGYVGAIVLAIFGAVLSLWTLVGIAFFGIFTCYLTQKQMQYTNEMMGFEDDEFAMSLSYGQEDDQHEPRKPAMPTRQLKAAAKQAQREQEEAEEVDRILKKIAETGMNSLSRAEKKLLQQATEHKRKQQ